MASTDHVGRSVPFYSFSNGVTSSDRAGSIHTSQCRVLKLNGELVYSPNSARCVEIPDVSTEKGNPFMPTPRQGRMNYWEFDISQFRKPRWLQRAFVYHAFIPIHPTFNSFLFAPILHATPRFIRLEDKMYILDPREKDAWLLLDNTLYGAARVLKHKYNVAMIYPANPWYMGYLRPHAKLSTLRLCLQKSRDWFVVWMGLLSFLIANSESVSLEKAERWLWMSILQDHGKPFGITPAWVDALSMSSVHSFTPNTLRTGTFLHLPSRDLQPSVEWFCSFNVPVWYPWGQAQMADPSLAHLAPPSHMVQESHTFILLVPSSRGIAPPNQASSESTTQHPFKLSTKQLEFLNSRAAINAKAILSETPLDKMQRENRQAKPPPASKRGKARVFEWTSDDSGDYERVEVPSKSREDVLGDHSSEQIRYDPVQNEYDICADWGRDPSDIAEAEEEEARRNGGNEVESFSGDNTDPEAVHQMAHQINLPHVFDETPWKPVALRFAADGGSGTLIVQGSRSELDRLESNVRMTMRMWFGFSPSPPLLEQPPIETEKDQKVFCRLLGWTWNMVKENRGLFSRPFIVASARFLDCLSRQPSTIDPQDWDLNRFNHSCLVNTSRFSCLKILTTASGRKVYMFDLGNARTVRWNIALNTASEAMVVCRLDNSMDERDIAQFLVDYGISFHTLQPSSSVVRTPRVNRPPMKIPVRNDAHIFTADDYIVYRNNCYYMLRHPRGRAALMYGTYVGRIAQNIVSLESVFDGPSGWSMDASEMFVVTDIDTGIEYIDDQLTEEEKLMLIGRYDCHTGMLIDIYKRFY